MIQANELRIGNAVQDDTGRIGIITELSKKSVRLKMGFSTLKIDTHHDEQGIDVNPIPLTPEILEKAGFGIKYETKDEFGLIIENEGILIELSENYITEGRAVFYYNLPDTQTHKCIAYCKYLHQLQNLYFALTQTELNIKQ